jgi:TPR repeat protein
MLLLSSCRTPQKAPSINQSCFIPDKALPALKEKAEFGDAESSFKIYRYYLFWMKNEVMADKWLRIAAFQGHQIAKYNLAIQEEDSRKD